MKETEVSRGEYKNLIEATKNDMDEIFRGTKKSCKNMVSDLQTWAYELKERHQGIISRAKFLDFICYMFMGIASIYFIFLFISWILSTLNGSAPPPPVI